MKKIPESDLKKLLTQGVSSVIDKDFLIQALRSGKTLRVKHGVDPTTSDLHLGYAVVYRKLKILQDLGHKIIFLIGGFTARFGDPSDRTKARELKNKNEVERLSKKYLTQVGKILDLKKTEIRYNSQWYDKMSAEDLLKIMAHFTVARMLERDMFQERIKNKKEIGLHEPVYPVLQAYDSVMLKSDLTIIGQDQLFNELQARKLQGDFKQRPQAIVAVQMLLGVDGEKKMSQSLGNEILISDPPQEMYGKVMSIPDSLIVHYFGLLGLASPRELSNIKKELSSARCNPRDVKADLAYKITELFHGKGKADKARQEFDRIFRSREIPKEIKLYKLNKKRINILELIVFLKITESKSQARRLIEQGGVGINGRKVQDWRTDVDIGKGITLKAGKRKFFKVK